MLAWSLLVILGYAAYHTFPYSENMWLVAIEYLIVIGWIAYEISGKRIKRAIMKVFPG